MCDIIEGELPIITSNGEEEELVINDNLEIVKETVPYNDSDICYSNYDTVKLWLGINRIDTTQWSNPYDLFQNIDLELPYA